ncbi:MAG TPA: LysR substrate-binding domain-containing protein, partial [Burkholderiaceae bacterium]|nr:LysR substrate-binding domain-containing protein [Burkholderiaceae bacterium]
MNLLEALRYLAALDQHRHFGRAAMACRITQPALSNAIRALETELGVPVVRRSRQYEGLTAEGEVVLAHAHRLLREAEAMRQELHSREEAPRGRLQIGAVPTAMTIATRFALRVRERHGGLAPVVRSLSSQEIEAGIENLSLDVGLGYTGRTEVGARAMQVWPQYAEAYYVVQRAPGSAGALRVGAPIGWREASTLPLTLLTPDMHNRTIVDQAFREAGAEVNATLETNSVLALLTALAAGDVAAVLPGALVRSVLNVADLLARPLVEPTVSTPIGFMSSKSERATPALRAALTIAQDPVWLEEAAAHS